MSSFLVSRQIIRRFSSHSKLFQQIKLKISNSGVVVPVFTNASQYPGKIALTDTVGSYTYGNIFLSAKELSKEIKQKVGRSHERIMFLCPNDANYVITLWAIWMAGQIAVPLSPLHPKNLLLYYANDTKSKLLVTTPQYVDLMQKIATNASINLHVLDDKLSLNATEKIPLESENWDAGMDLKFYDKSNAMILYTSGTTGNPKGVVITHRNVVYQVNMLLDAWKWTEYDAILHTLPLHHVHGIVNALLCPLYAGAKTVMLPKFDPKIVWSNLLGIGTKPNDKKITVFMAVPTIYQKLIDEYEKVFQSDKKMVSYIERSLKSKMRLMVSGSAPLPAKIFNRWFQITGHQLLERYGMTETGMCLSNLYDAKREPAYVGVPLPGVSIRIVDDNNKILLECSNDNGKIAIGKKVTIAPSGELQVKSGGVFKEYFNRPETTKSEFTVDGWFRTGDICEYVEEKKIFKIIGRKSTDIIKSGGYKVGALIVENQLLDHPNIRECAVVGIDDEVWGQRVAAIIVPQDTKKSVTVDKLKEWLKEKLPIYAIPTIVKVVDVIPKNPMGKVNKKELVKTVFSDINKSN